MFFFLPLIDCCRRLTHLQELSLRYISEAFILIYWLIYWPALCKPSETTEADFGEFSSSAPFFLLRLNHCLSVRLADQRCWNTPAPDVMCSRLRKTETVKLSSTLDAAARAVSLGFFSFFVISWICVSGAFFMNLNYLCFDYFCWCIVSHVMKDSNEQLSLKNTN